MAWLQPPCKRDVKFSSPDGAFTTSIYIIHDSLHFLKGILNCFDRILYGVVWLMYIRANFYSRISNSRSNLLPMLQKYVALLLIISYFLLPTLCYADPCELRISSSSEIVDSSSNQQSTDCPEADDADNCETTCCCAGHVPLSALTEISHADLAAKLLPYEPHLALPRLMDRIFVPPQNLA